MKSKFGEDLKKLREDRKLTLREVEEQAHISNAYLSQVERGERGVPTMKVLAKLAQVYGVPISLLNQKAEAQLKLSTLQWGIMNSIQKRKDKSYKSEGSILGDAKEIPVPDTDYICRAYASLSEEKKQALKNYLQFLQNEPKSKK